MALERKYRDIVKRIFPRAGQLETFCFPSEDPKADQMTAILETRKDQHDCPYHIIHTTWYDESDKALNTRTVIIRTDLGPESFYVYDYSYVLTPDSSPGDEPETLWLATSALHARRPEREDAIVVRREGCERVTKAILDWIDQNTQNLGRER